MKWRHAFGPGANAAVSWPARLVALILALCLVGAVTYWVMILTAPKTVIAPSNLGAGSGRDVSAQQATQLFGLASSSAAPTTSTTLASVQVQGIISAGPRGAAIISFDGKPGRFVGVGFTLGPEKPDAKLVEVKPGAVVININGRSEEYQAPVRPSMAILTSGVGRTRNPAEGGTNLPSPSQSPLAQPGQAISAPGTNPSAVQQPLPAQGATPAGLPPLPPSGAAAAGSGDAGLQGAAGISPRSGGPPPGMAKPGPSNP